jgi:hypothetical protein
MQNALIFIEALEIAAKNCVSCLARRCSKPSAQFRPGWSTNKNKDFEKSASAALWLLDP